jgi:phosphoribosylglycinamide formyltransferase-1
VTSEAPPASVVVLISGTGTILTAMLEAASDPAYGAAVAAVISDRPDAGGLDVARAAGFPTAVVALRDFPSREDWNRAIVRAIDAHAPDLVVLAGFMKILAPATVSHFGGRVINTHPALLPSFPGAHGVRDALEYGVKVTGCTVIFVDDGVDTGPIVAQATVPVEPGDTEDTLHERIKSVERTLVVDTVHALVTRGWTIEGRHVVLGTPRKDGA